MKGKEKSLIERFKPFWDTGIKLSETEKKIGFCVKNYAVTQIFTNFKTNSSALKENEKKIFEGMVKELAAEKKAIGPDANCTVEEYLEFLQNSFENIDDEDRHGEITMQTSYNFRLLGDLIDVLIQWGPVPDEWIKKSKDIILIYKLIIEKYSKFKAVDIYKSLKQGVTPKRGGPKEAEDDLSKELNKMMVEDKDEKIKTQNINTNNLEQHSNININTMNPQHISSESKQTDKFDINIDLPSTNIKPTTITDPRRTMDRHDINESLQSKSFDKQINQDDKYNTKDTHDLDIKDNNTNITNTNTNINNKTTASSGNVKSININKKDIDKYSSNSSHSLDLKKNNNSLLAPDFKIDSKIKNSKTDFSFPVKFRSLEYFRLIDSINKIIGTSQRELDSNKVDKSLAQMELVLYYLHNIQK